MTLVRRIDQTRPHCMSSQQSKAEHMTCHVLHYAGEDDDAIACLGAAMPAGGGYGYGAGATVPAILMLRGPHGCGKSAAAYACARQAGYKVLEIHAGQRRSVSVSGAFGSCRYDRIRYDRIPTWVVLASHVLCGEG
jgi:DNA polymerase III delta prime subunit